MRHGTVRHKARRSVYGLVGGFRLDRGEGYVSEDERLSLVFCHIEGGLFLVRDDEGTIIASSNLAPGRSIAVYVGVSGDWWARDYEEFVDGRFDIGEDTMEEELDRATILSYINRSQPRVTAKSERLARMARMVVRLGHEVIRLREGKK